jgi:glycosyltransferase involved in cell wall biosynthesis
MEPVTPGTPYPDAAELAAHVASLYGLRRILDVGGAWSPELRIAYPRLRPVAGGRSADGSSPAAALVTGSSGGLLTPEGPLAGLADLLAGLSLIVIATDDGAPVADWLADRDVRPTFAGRTRLTEADGERRAHLLVVDRALDRVVAGAGAPPDDFRVVALMAAFNEEDVIGPAIEKLAGDGVGVYVIDNWSTDRTWEIAQGLEGRGVIGLERFPARPGGSFVLRALLRRTTELAAGLDATWFIHHDADERRRGPWPGAGLREALWRVDRAGFNAVDFTVANYRPIDDSFEPGDDFEARFRHFEFGATSDLLLQIKAWKNVGRVDLAGSAGHQARFRGRRVFPYKFLLKHYPIRSQAHGERKIFRERIPRWDRHERVRGWHVHYNEFSPGQSFLRDPAELIEDRGEETWAAYLPELLAGAGLIRRDYPAWALDRPAGRAAFLARQSVDRSRPARLWRDVVGKGRGAMRRLRSAVGRGRR